MSATATETAPNLNRAVELSFAGDWGGANLTRVCGWLAQEVWDNSAPEGYSTIRTARGSIDNLHLVGRGEVDLAVMTPAGLARAALKGTGPFAGSPYESLRAIGTVPHFDRLLLAVRGHPELDSIEAIREAKPALRLAMSSNDGVNTCGLAAHRALELSGLPVAELLEWGGSLIEDERPMPLLDAVLEGRADAVVHEAIMVPHWQELAATGEATFVSWEDSTLAALDAELGLGPAVVEPGYFAGIDYPVKGVDFSGYLLACRADLPDDVAYLLAWIMNERNGRIVHGFKHIPSERSPVNYPFTREGLSDVPIPLHPGAAAYWDK